MTVLVRPAEAYLSAGQRAAPGPDRAARALPRAAAASLLLHGVALAAVLLWLGRSVPADPPPEKGVEVVWDAAPTATEQASGATTDQPGQPPAVEARVAPRAPQR